MRKIAAALLGCLAAAAPSPRARAAAPAAGFVAGRFDSYALVLSWESAFCETNRAVSDCRSETPERFDASHLSLHGLWPEVKGDAKRLYGYCGLDQATKDLDFRQTWCQLPEPPLSPATRAALAAVMPGSATCLDHHEWSRHGTCSSLDVDAYFAEAAALAQRVSGGELGRFLHEHVGERVPAADVRAAFERDFGPDSGDKIALDCTKIRDESALIEARLHLPKALPPPAQLPSMLVDAGDAGNCPSTFLLDGIPR